MIIFYENVLITGFVHDNLRKGRRGEKKDKEQYSGGRGGVDHDVLCINTKSIADISPGHYNNNDNKANFYAPT